MLGAEAQRPGLNRLLSHRLLPSVTVFPATGDRWARSMVRDQDLIPSQTVTFDWSM